MPHNHDSTLLPFPRVSSPELVPKKNAPLLEHRVDGLAYVATTGKIWRRISKGESFWGFLGYSGALSRRRVSLAPEDCTCISTVYSPRARGRKRDGRRGQNFCLGGGGGLPRARPKGTAATVFSIARPQNLNQPSATFRWGVEDRPSGRLPPLFPAPKSPPFPYLLLFLERRRPKILPHLSWVLRPPPQLRPFEKVFGEGGGEGAKG